MMAQYFGMDCTGEAQVFGFDFSGFSHWVAQRIEQGGSAATEKVTDEINAALSHIEAGIAGVNAEVLETLGDGLIAAKTEPFATSDQDIEQQLANLVAGCGIDLPCRIAAARGKVESIQLAGGLKLWTGPGILHCHQKMDIAPRTPFFNGILPNQQPAVPRLIGGEIVNETIAFIRVGGGDFWPCADQLDEIALIISAMAERASGKLEKATHDAKGIMFRAHFPGGLDGAEWCDETYSALKGHAQIGIGLAQGSIYRSLSSRPGEAPIVHGPAVNRAAKLAASGSGIFLDGSTMRPAPRPSQTTIVQEGAPAAIREQELGQVSEFLNGPPALLEIVGDPGMGKSHFFSAILASNAPNFVTHRGTARPQSILEPFSIWRDMIRASGLMNNSMALAAAPPASGEAGLQLWAEQLEQAFADLARRGPTLFLIDDVQWADTWSLALLNRMRHHHCHFICAKRPAKMALNADQQMMLLPLDPQQIEQLVGSDKQMAEIARLAGGSPFFALQMASAIADGITDHHHPFKLDGLIDHRLKSLSPDDRALIRLVAVLARPIALNRLQDFGDRVGIKIATSQITHLGERQFLQVGDGTVDVVHRLMNERVIAGVPPSLIPTLHAGAARVLEQMIHAGHHGVGWGEIAAHWQSAGANGRAAICFAKGAEIALGGGAYQAAAEFFAGAASQMGQNRSPRPDRQAYWAASRSIALWGMGHVKLAAEESLAARHHITEAVQKLRRRDSTSRKMRINAAKLRSAVIQAETGHYQGRVSDIFIGNIGTIRWGGQAHDRSTARARGLSFVATTFGTLRMGGIANLVYKVGHALPGPPQARGFVYAAQAVCALGFGRWHQADQFLNSAALILEEAPEPHLSDVILTLHGLSANMTGNHQLCRQSFNALKARAALRGNRLFEAWGHYGHAMADLADGHLSAASQSVSIAQALLDGLGDKQSTFICTGLAVQLAALMGDEERALAEAMAAMNAAHIPPPTNFGSLEGYTGPALALVRLAWKAESSAVRANAMLALPKAISMARRYAWMFPIGRPRLAYLKAVVQFKKPQIAIEKALALSMHGDAANMMNDGLWRL